MANTVNTAFDSFMKNTVNLDSAVTKSARSSRDWLVTQIRSFEGSVADFPSLYSEQDIFFGSFERKTKKRELDDIDLIICLKAQYGTYLEYSDRVELTASDYCPILRKYCHDYTNIINSKKIVNKFVSALSNVHQYKKAEINRRQEAAILNLNSYLWSFDIVPSFFTNPDVYGKTYYLIPDGQGHWKKTDPRIDRAKVTTTNQYHNGNVLNAIRIMKYWNRRATMPSMGSYLLENMILDYYGSRLDKASSYVDIEITNLFSHINTAVYSNVYDPKGIQGNLNTLSYEEMKKISDRAELDLKRAREARAFEDNNNHEAAIKKWAEIFGAYFPTYG